MRISDLVDSAVRKRVRGRENLPPFDVPELNVVFVQKITWSKGCGRPEDECGSDSRRVPSRERPDRPEVQLKTRVRLALRL
jgi:hypothetical protein